MTPRANNKVKAEPAWRDARLLRYASLGVIGVAILLGLGGVSKQWQPAAGHSVKIVNEYPHERSAFTQGLVFDRGQLVEGTGRYGRSELRRIELPSGRVVSRQALPAHLFGEGVSVVGERIIQLTWRERTVLFWDRELSLQGRAGYPREGWGLTYDGRHLIASDGSARLYFLDTDSLALQREVWVHDHGRPVSHLNELEYIDGEIYANVLGKPHIARISPRSGEVLGWVDLSELVQRQADVEGASVLNGIAYDPLGRRLFVTGKLWDSIYEIALVPRPR